MKLVTQASKGFLHWAIIIVNIVITFSVGSYCSGQNTLNTFLEKIPSLKWGVKDIFIYKVQCDDITRAKEMLSLAIQRIELSIVTVGMTDRVDKALEFNLEGTAGKEGISKRVNGMIKDKNAGKSKIFTGHYALFI